MVVDIDAHYLGQVRITYELKSYARQKARYWFWCAVHAELDETRSRDDKMEPFATVGAQMQRPTKTTTELMEAVRLALINDKALEWKLSDIPYIGIHAVPPGHPTDVANWDLSVTSCSTEMAAAIQRAKVAVQKDYDLALPPLGSSTIG